MTTEQKILDILSHLWPYISGIFVVILAMMRLWWHDRNQIKQEIKNVGAQELQHFNDNQTEHGEILEKMNEQHIETINKMLELHKK